ncbi:acyl-CoA dehydrogenase family protein [Cupriavidus sp. AU9028]|uniref:acyl-CoA dehydrogenase family protein n=1 Tax=Cupriavidus sp. AU9028 TaxID=2871157 RepID=UPI001C959B7F|nr:acyl-CoA dehydrogenase family protein [Cupriavidus sp. AU9028]
METASKIVIQPAAPDGDLAPLRQQVRAFLARTIPDRPAPLRAKSWSGYDPAFSRALGEQGWIGMTWPKAYGGGERSMLERYVVLEELLAAGAPVGGHWVAERQSGPLLMRYADPEVAREIVPRICKGELRFCIGMSEPDSGSDLASIRTRADRVEGGWVVNGTKLWTSNAHHSQYMIALVRTDRSAADKHQGLSQFLIDMRSEGLQVRPIRNLAGDEGFNEVVFDNVFVPQRMLIGTEGEGWAQVTAELTFERSGPERYLSSYALLAEMVAHADADDPRHAVELGHLIAELSTLRQMSRGIAAMLNRGENPQLAAANVKDLGALFEQRIPEVAHQLFDHAMLPDDDPFVATHCYLTQVVPSFSLRGGTREILRGIIAKGLGIR